MHRFSHWLLCLANGRTKELIVFLCLSHSPDHFPSPPRLSQPQSPSCPQVIIVCPSRTSLGSLWPRDRPNAIGTHQQTKTLGRDTGPVCDVGHLVSLSSAAARAWGWPSGVPVGEQLGDKVGQLQQLTRVTRVAVVA